MNDSFQIALFAYLSINSSENALESEDFRRILPNLIKNSIFMHSFCDDSGILLAQ